MTQTASLQQDAVTHFMNVYNNNKKFEIKSFLTYKRMPLVTG